MKLAFLSPIGGLNDDILLLVVRERQVGLIKEKSGKERFVVLLLLWYYYWIGWEGTKKKLSFAVT